VHAAFAAVVPPPSAPATTTGNYTVTYSTNAFRAILQERAPGASAWTAVSTAGSNGSVSFTGKPPGVYQYRTYWLKWVIYGEDDGRTRGGRELVDMYSSTISVTVSGPAIVLDDEYTQLQYRFEVRLGDVNGDGRSDIYIKRLDGSADNGVVYESVAYQNADGRFGLPSNSASIVAAARSYPVASVIVNGGDLDLDGYSDPTVLGFPASANILYPQTFLSSGQQYQRNARAVVATDEAVEMFERDMREARFDPGYFDNAGTPDQPGYRIELVYEYGYCYSFYGFPVCFSDTINVLIGEFSLSQLGISSGAPSGGIQKLSNGTISTPSSNGVAQQAQQKTAAIVGSAATVSPSLIGTSAEKAAAAAYFGISAPWPDTLVCVWICGYRIWGDYYGYAYEAWYDVWTPITIPGEFDDVNYSRDAYEAYQSEVELLEALNALPGTEGIGDILTKTDDYTGRMRRGWGIPNPFEIILKPIFEAVGDQVEKTKEGVKIIVAQAEILKACTLAKDPEECIAAMEDAVIGDTADGEPIGGVWGEDEMDEDSMSNPDSRLRRQLALLVTAVGAAASPGRWQCSYTKYNSAQQLYYHGITSTISSGNCVDAVRKRSQQHDASPRFRRTPGWTPSSPDREIPPTATLPGSLLVTRGVIRGREQQLIDFDTHRLFTPTGVELRGIDARNYNKTASRLFNRIRSVAKRNPAGCLMWKGSNILFLTYSPFTGIESFCVLE
jgi:hypothetical protein